MLRRNIYTLTILKECLLGPGKHTRTIDFAPDIEGKVDKLLMTPYAYFST